MIRAPGWLSRIRISSRERVARRPHDRHAGHARPPPSSDRSPDQTPGPRARRSHASAETIRPTRTSRPSIIQMQASTPGPGTVDRLPAPLPGRAKTGTIRRPVARRARSSGPATAGRRVARRPPAAGPSALDLDLEPLGATERTASGPRRLEDTRATAPGSPADVSRMVGERPAVKGTSQASAAGPGTARG